MPSTWLVFSRASLPRVRTYAERSSSHAAHHGRGQSEAGHDRSDRGCRPVRRQLIEHVPSEHLPLRRFLDVHDGCGARDRDGFGDGADAQLDIDRHVGVGLHLDPFAADRREAVERERQGIHAGTQIGKRDRPWPSVTADRVSRSARDSRPRR